MVGIIQRKVESLFSMVLRQDLIPDRFTFGPRRGIEIIKEDVMRSFITHDCSSVFSNFKDKA